MSYFQNFQNGLGPKLGFLHVSASCWCVLFDLQCHAKNRQQFLVLDLLGAR